MTHLSRAAALALAVLMTNGLAATHYVRPGATGANTGADWTNAWSSMPAALVRGDTYYLAGGSYGSHTFNDAASGTKTITILRATAADHGTSTGWQPAYGNGTAVFTHWDVFTDWYVFDGRRRNADWNLGTTSQYGIRVQGANPPGEKTLRLDDGNGHGSNHLVFRFIDFVGGGRDTGNGDDVVYGLTGNSDLTFQYDSLHDSDRTIILTRGNWQRLLVDHCYMARNTSTPAVHGELISMTDTTNVTWSNNVMEDIEGTAFIAGMNGGTAAHWQIFGNVALHTAAYIADTGRKPGHNYGVAGLVYIAHDTDNQNVGNDIEVMNNTIVDVVGVWSGVVIQAGSGNVMRNNLWYSSVETGTAFSGTISHNWYYNTQADGDSTPTKVVCTTGCNVFVDLPNRNFHLVKSLPAGYALPAPVSVDSTGVTRGIDGTWDRGAYEFSGNMLSPSAAPKGLTVR
jgi:hypothetical protein